MKKILSLTLSLCLALCLLTAIAPEARAASYEGAQDRIIGYMVAYTVNSDDTVYNICRVNNVNFVLNAELIAKFNGIDDLDLVNAGNTIYLPTDSPAGYDCYFTLISHTIQPGEVLADVCLSYGIDYANYMYHLSILNPNLAGPLPGQQLVLPVYTGENEVELPTVALEVRSQESLELTRNDFNAMYLSPAVLREGDTVASLCAEMGIDFAVNSELIKNINGISDFSTLSTGTLLYLPSQTMGNGSCYKIVVHMMGEGEKGSDLLSAYSLCWFTSGKAFCALNNISAPNDLRYGETALVIVPCSYSEAASSILVNVSGEGSSSAQDIFVYYLYPYTMELDDTVLKACSAVGIDFYSNIETIARVNRIRDWRKVMVGDTVLLPMGNIGESGGYMVMSHRLTRGESVESVCELYGIDLEENLDLISAVNGDVPLSSLGTGSSIYIPVPQD